MKEQRPPLDVRGMTGVHKAILMNFPPYLSLLERCYFATPSFCGKSRSLGLPFNSRSNHKLSLAPTVICPCAQATE